MRHSAGLLLALIVATSAACGRPEPPPIAGLPSPASSPPVPAPPGSGDFAFQQFSFPLSVADAEQILLRTQIFAVGLMGPKRQVQAYNRIFDQPDARTRFEGIASGAATAGKLYALCGLGALGAEPAGSLEVAVLADPGRLLFFDSDVVWDLSPRELIGQIRRNRICDEIRREKKEVEKAFEQEQFRGRR